MGIRVNMNRTLSLMIVFSSLYLQGCNNDFSEEEAKAGLAYFELSLPSYAKNMQSVEDFDGPDVFICVRFEIPEDKMDSVLVDIGFLKSDIKNGHMDDPISLTEIPWTPELLEEPKSACASKYVRGPRTASVGKHDGKVVVYIECFTI